MNPTQLLAFFDRISEAPDAMSRLRRFILDLAVRGELVEQDPKDEPASELLKRIQTARAQLVKAGEIRKERPLPLVEEDEAPYSPPTGWEWVRIRQVTSDRGQVTPDKDFTYIDVTAINKEVGCVADAKVLSPLDAPSRARKMVRTGDVLYSCVRPYLLNIAVIEKDIVPSPIASTAFAVLNGFGLVLSKYLWIALRSPFMVECVEAKMRGQAYPAINDSDFAILPLPLPPLAEQHCIVAKVDELMALCDRLAAAQAERENRRDRLAAASLHRLNNGADVESFREHARFHLRHLPRLTTHPEQIQQLHQTILNLAVRGRLVLQDPNDESASELLKRIQAVKVRLVKQGKIRRDRPLPLIAEEDNLGQLPNGWEWVRMQEAFDVRDGTHDTPKYIEDDGVPLITSRNFVDGRISFEDAKLISWDDHNSIKKRSGIDQGDILYSMIGGNIGNQVMVETDREFSIKNVALFKYYSKSDTPPAYLDLFLKIVTIGLQGQAAGGAQPFVSLKQLRSIPFPMPPLAEQHRIVAKVEELMALCSQLTAQLTTTQKESYSLLEAVLHEALGSSSNPSMQRLYGTQGKSVIGHDPAVESSVPLIQGRA